MAGGTEAPMALAEADFITAFPEPFRAGRTAVRGEGLDFIKSGTVLAIGPRCLEQTTDDVQTVVVFILKEFDASDTGAVPSTGKSGFGNRSGGVETFIGTELDMN